MISTNDAFYVAPNDFVQAVQVVEGLKVWFTNKKSCLEMEKELNNLGIKTRVGCNEAGTWSIYIISVPEELVETYQEL